MKPSVCDYLISRLIPFGGPTRGGHIEEERCKKVAKHFYFVPFTLTVGYSNRYTGYLATCNEHKVENAEAEIAEAEYISATVLES